jgi:hypothetical protein
MGLYVERREGVGRVVAETAAAEGGGKPLLSFGVIADVQYCDIPDAYNYSRTQVAGGHPPPDRCRARRCRACS